VSANDEAIAAAVRAADPDRYLSVLYAPAPLRDDLLALYAFNAEIASIRDRVREPLPGEIRLQWWRDVLAAQEERTGHPVADALLLAIRRRGLPTAAFMALLDARVFDLYDDPMPSRTDLEGYCGEVAGSLLQLAALILAPDAARDAADMAGHAGCAQAIAGLLQNLALHRARGQCFVPLDVLSAAGTDRDGFLAGTDAAANLRAVAAMAALARQHLRSFEAAARTMPAALAPAYLPLEISRLVLARIEADPQACLRAPVAISPMRRHLAVLKRATLGWPRR
jgi:phytoene synthase